MGDKKYNVPFRSTEDNIIVDGSKMYVSFDPNDPMRIMKPIPYNAIIGVVTILLILTILFTLANWYFSRFAFYRKVNAIKTGANYIF